MENVICRSCGAAIPHTDLFCRRCGAQTEPRQHIPHCTEQASGRNQQYKGRGKKAAIATIIAVIVVSEIGSFVDRIQQGASSKVYPLATQLHIFRAGEFWEYSVQGQLAARGTSTQITGGHARVTIASVTGGPKSIVTVTSLVKGNAVANGTTFPISMQYTETIQQDVTNGATYLMQDGDASGRVQRRAIPPLPIELPGKWYQGMTDVHNVKFDNGDGEHDALHVTGTAVISVAAGSYQTWTYSSTSSMSSGKQTATSNWFAPQLGQPVRVISTATERNGTSVMIDMLLIRTNVREL